MSNQTDKFEVEETIKQLRAMKPSLNDYQQYWIEEAVCSLAGMEKQIKDFLGALK